MRSWSLLLARLALLLCVSGWATGCQQKVVSTGSPLELSSDNLHTDEEPKNEDIKIIEEIDPVISQEELRDGLLRAKTVLLNLPFLTTEEQRISTIEAYRARIQTYLNNPKTPLAVLRMYQQVFNLEGIASISDFNQNNYPGSPNQYVNQNLPSNLAAYLYREDRNFSELITANYCVGDWIDNPGQGEISLDPNVACEVKGRTVPTGTMDPRLWFNAILDPEMRAGAITTQAYLRSTYGGTGFRRPNRIAQHFLCSEAPSFFIEASEIWSTDDNLSERYAYNPDESDLNCPTCHGGGLNSIRQVFAGFGSEGEPQMGQFGQKIYPLDMAGSDIRADYLLVEDLEGLGSSPQGSFEPLPNRLYGRLITTESYRAEAEYPKPRDFTEGLAQTDQFKKCLGQRVFNFMLGRSQSHLNKAPTSVEEIALKAFNENDGKLKSIFSAIAESTEYLNTQTGDQ